MFTGIITEIGRVVVGGPRLRLEAPATAARLAVGGSVAINGACLTAVDVTATGFTVEAIDETLRRTNLGLLEAGGSVNLELPMRAGDPLDGHLVLGHVDGTGTVLQERGAELGRELTFELAEALAPYVAEKGSIAIDGTSLTVTAVGDDFFGVAFIPHTLDQTIAGRYQRGTVVNLEVDVVARYLERLVRPSIEKS